VNNPTISSKERTVEINWSFHFVFSLHQDKRITVHGNNGSNNATFNLVLIFATFSGLKSTFKRLICSIKFFSNLAYLGLFQFFASSIFALKTSLNFLIDILQGKGFQVSLENKIDSITSGNLIF
jgi:hypothetical protein